MESYESLREPMDMPDPHFPVKVHHNHFEHQGEVLFRHHWHEHLEFLYFVSGEALIECGSTPIAAKAGELIVLNSNELHYGVSLSTKVNYYALIVDISLLHSQFAGAAETKFITPITQNRLLLRNHVKDDPLAFSSVLAIVNELKSREFGYELAVKSGLYQLLTLLVRNHLESVLTRNEYAERIKNVERFAPVFQYIEDNYHSELSVELLAEIAGLSRFHFSRLFKELSGRTITEYITAARLDKADDLLRNSKLTVSEVATATGFNDIYYFSRTYKKHRNIAPSTLRGEALS
ncbi:AraC family transcriptional regulator [Paenibacillus pinihumi]|uniref:AraC family transcriptional regulator n=1 Tax=Paenibacillus pinihumi TaxID=669462 RepID=UPI000413C675|nr:AraC family transcriptional regulator [Paenibacillus pinihumi]